MWKVAGLQSLLALATSESVLAASAAAAGAASPFASAMGFDGPADFEILIDNTVPDSERHLFEGVGALSAGGSSRLLWDYGEEARSKILDLLFLPNYGAALHILKVEIGGDTQSTDGAEPSHLHDRDAASLDCNRGYEVWLLSEAKRRNPSILTYGLSWGVPGWVGNETFFSDDNIKYQVDWLKCMKSEASAEIDYLGIWNERAWGDVRYIQRLRSALDEANFVKTQLILSDGGPLGDLPEKIENDPVLRSTFHAVGRHYPCKNASWPALQRFGKSYWSSEEASVPADWGGAGCWGRLLNQNYVRMNMTANIAWSLVWSAYSNLDCFGNGLLYAFQPWSGKFSVNLPIWTTAHTTQFVQPGWHYLYPSSGTLPQGGTYVTLTDGLGNFTIIVETLTGECFYHSGCFHDVTPTTPQRLALKLPAQLNTTHLVQWTSNETSQFVSTPGLPIGRDGRVVLDVPPDTIITLTTPGNVRGQSKARSDSIPAPDEQGGTDPFPMTFEEDFEAYPKPISGNMPTYFSVQSGAWEASGGCLRQVVHRAPGRNAWTCNSLPFTHLGDANWSDYRASVQARVPDVTSDVDHHRSPDQQVGLCVRVLRYPGFLCGDVPGYCLQLGLSGWRLTTTRGSIVASAQSQRNKPTTFADAASSPSGALATTTSATATATAPSSLVLASGGSPALSVGQWATLELRVQGLEVISLVDGVVVATIRSTNVGRGQVALQSGWHSAEFDNLIIEPLSSLVGRHPRAVRQAQEQEQQHRQRQQQRQQQQQQPQHQQQQQQQQQQLFQHLALASWDWHLRTCDPAPRDLGSGLRNNFGGFVGMKIEIFRPVHPVALGRWRYDGTVETHTLSLVQETPGGNRSWSLKLDSSNRVDDLGFAWAVWTFSSSDYDAEMLSPGMYYVLSEEFAGTGTDYWLDQGVEVTEQPWGRVVTAVYGASLTNLQAGLHHTAFGPVNLMVQVPAGEVLADQVDRGSAEGDSALGLSSLDISAKGKVPGIPLNTFFA